MLGLTPLINVLFEDKSANRSTSLLHAFWRPSFEFCAVSLSVGLAGRGGVDNTSNSMGFGECAGDEPADDMMKSPLSAAAVLAFFSGVVSAVFSVLNVNLLPFGFGAGEKFF